MRMLLIRSGLAVGTVMLVEQWPFPTLPALWALLIWAAPRVIRDRREARRFRTMSGLLVLRIDTLEAELASAADLNDRLQKQVRGFQESFASTDGPSPRKGSGHLLFWKVGLDQDAPQWVIEAVRREYQKRLHPDTKPPEQKVEAERRFKSAEEVFSEIWRVRGF